ncbi:MAG: helix-turn-helix transcriptional regulator [Spirochaetes bacterium]|nr:helix-turn-helix transcriptional regulator [Spirochaetota bacterium]
MNTKEVAEYLGINEKQVYALIKKRGIPCTRITGKWLFPRHLIDAWVDENARSGYTGGAGAPGHRHLLAAGSNDPVLDVLLNRMKRPGGRNLFSCSTGSTGGLEMLAVGGADIAWCHLHDAETGTYNVTQASAALEGRKIAVVHLFYRELGFVASAEGRTISSFRDLAAPGVVFVNRQAGSGTRLFIDQQLAAQGIPPESIRGYEREVYTHLEVALAVVSGDAAAGVASSAAAAMMGLHFSPLARESFDMVLLQETFFTREIQDFIAALQSEEFKRQVCPMGNYDFNESGRILFSN